MAIQFPISLLGAISQIGSCFSSCFHPPRNQLRERESKKSNIQLPALYLENTRPPQQELDRLTTALTQSANKKSPGRQVCTHRPGPDRKEFRVSESLLPPSTVQ